MEVDNDDDNDDIIIPLSSEPKEKELMRETDHDYLHEPLTKKPKLKEPDEQPSTVDEKMHKLKKELAIAEKKIAKKTQQLTRLQEDKKQQVAMKAFLTKCPQAEPKTSIVPISSKKTFEFRPFKDFVLPLGCSKLIPPTVWTQRSSEADFEAAIQAKNYDLATIPLSRSKNHSLGPKRAFKKIIMIDGNDACLSLSDTRPLSSSSLSRKSIKPKKRASISIHENKKRSMILNSNDKKYSKESVRGDELLKLIKRDKIEREDDFFVNDSEAEDEDFLDDDSNSLCEDNDENIIDAESLGSIDTKDDDDDVLTQDDYEDDGFVEMNHDGDTGLKLSKALQITELRPTLYKFDKSLEYYKANDKLLYDLLMQYKIVKLQAPLSASAMRAKKKK